MSKNEDVNKTSNQIIDMLVDTTLKRHGVKLGEKKIDPNEKEEVRKMVNNLRQNVEALSKKKKSDTTENE